MPTNFNSALPAGTSKMRDSDDFIRANWVALQDALQRDHEFPGDENATAGQHRVVQLQDQGDDPETGSDIIGLYNNGDRLFFRKADSQTIIELGVSAIEPGTKMVFIQNAAPTGWTFIAENNDSVLINASVESEGGGTGGTWTIDGITVDGTALSVAQLPSHSHAVGGAGTIGNGGPGQAPYGPSGGNSGNNTNTTGSGSEHIHTLTSDAVWRPLFVAVITCSKDEPV